MLGTNGSSVGNRRFLNEKPLETDGASNGICRWDNRDLSLCTKKIVELPLCRSSTNINKVLITSQRTSFRF